MMRQYTAISIARRPERINYGSSYPWPESEDGVGMAERCNAPEHLAVCRSSRLMQDLRKSMTGRYLAIGKRIITSAPIKKRQYFQSPRNGSPGSRSWRSWQAKKPITRQQRSLTGYPGFLTSREKVSRLITALRIMDIVPSQIRFPSHIISPIPIRLGKKEPLRTQTIVFAGTFPGERC